MCTQVDSRSLACRRHSAFYFQANLLNLRLRLRVNLTPRLIFSRHRKIIRVFSARVSRGHSPLASRVLVPMGGLHFPNIPSDGSSTVAISTRGSRQTAPVTRHSGPHTTPGFQHQCPNRRNKRAWLTAVYPGSLQDLGPRIFSACWRSAQDGSAVPVKPTRCIETAIQSSTTPYIYITMPPVMFGRSSAALSSSLTLHFQPSSTSSPDWRNGEH
jgi:hypothetical protein